MSAEMALLNQVKNNTSGGINLANLLISQGNVDVFEASDTANETGIMLGFLIGDTFDEYKSLETITAIASSSTAMTVITSSSTAMTVITSSSKAMEAILSSSTAINTIVNSDIALKEICSSSLATTEVASIIQEYRTSIIATLDASSLFAKTTTTFSQISNTIKTELENTNTIVIPIQFEDAYPSGEDTSFVIRSLWYSSSQDYKIFESANQDINSVIQVLSINNVLGNPVVSLRGITHNQNGGNSTSVSRPTCDIYTVI